MRPRLKRILAVTTLVAAGLLASAPAATATGGAGVPAVGVPDLLGCKQAPTPEVPGRGVVGFFQSEPDTLPPAGDPFAKNSTTTIYEQYGYAGLRWNTYDLGCGPDLARAPDATVGTAVANWMMGLPKAAVAATGAVVDAAFSPDFLGVFDPLIETVVTTLQETVFEQWAFVVLAALGLLLIWRARKASLASSAGAIGWALLVMVLVTMVFRWPLVAGHAADETVTSTLAAVTGGLNDHRTGAPTAVTGTENGEESGQPDAALEAISGMQEALLYQAWLGGTFGNADSAVATEYGPTIFASQALTWREAEVLKTDPDQGKKIIEAKQKTFEETAAKIKAQDPDAYEYLTGQRSDSRVGYAVLAGFATLCAVPFLFAASLLVIGALVIVRFGVMLFPAFATLGLFPTMRSLVTGVGSTVASALINSLVFGIGAAVTVRGMGVLLAPSSAVPPWLAIVLMLLLTIVMWVALRPFRRLTQMVSTGRNHFGSAAGGVGTVTRGATRGAGRILAGAASVFLGVSAAKAGDGTDEAGDGAKRVPQRIEGFSSYDGGAGRAALAGTVSVTAGSVNVSQTPSAPAGGSGTGSGTERPAPVAAEGRSSSGDAWGDGTRFEGRSGGSWFDGGREEPRERPRAEVYANDPRLDEPDLDEVFRPAARRS
ncbi:hypothetical protein ACIB24_03955 [Spongisporangium articulatum]|uniref:TrbL/VirB6 plasmid conjugal transfer protein n=1 Tax=Spongisporangium articulatum TaxID=3362603 RepID=A0ABW8AIL9_9ACTN